MKHIKLRWRNKEKSLQNESYISQKQKQVSSINP